MKNPNHSKILILASFLAGALFLSLFSIPQKIALGVDPFVLRGFAVPVLFGGFIGVGLGFAYSSLKQKRIELERSHEELRLSALQYRSFIENHHAVMLMINPNSGDIVYANLSACRYYGYNKQALTSMKIYDINTLPKDEVTKEIDLAKNQNRGCFLFKHRLASGEIRDVEVYSGPSDYRGQKLLCSVIHDITDRLRAEADKKRLESELLQASKMEALGTMAGGIAHEFNNILAAIIGFSEIALEEAASGNPAPEQLKRVISSAVRARDLVSQILAFSRQAMFTLGPLEISPLISDAVSKIKLKLPESISLKLDIQQDLLQVRGNPEQIARVMHDLAVNARDAMPGGGVLTISCRNTNEQTEPGGGPGISPSGEYVCVQISDTGQGISEEVMGHIFDPFFTTKEVGKGSGLGLASVYGIMKSHGGHIKCESKPSEGTTIKLYFPALKTPGAPPAAAG